jgi:hypothetical protein
LSCKGAISGVPAAACDDCDDVDLQGYESLLEGLAGIPDPRRRKGTRHRAVVALAFAWRR